MHTFVAKGPIGGDHVAKLVSALEGKGPTLYEREHFALDIIIDSAGSSQERHKIVDKLPGSDLDKKVTAAVLNAEIAKLAEF